MVSPVPADHPVEGRAWITRDAEVSENILFTPAVASNAAFVMRQFTVVKPEQKLNALLPIVVTELGMVSVPVKP